MPSFDLYTAIRTQRAIRRFKPDPVPPNLVRQVLQSAVRAPSGSNRQPWAFVVVTDPQLKRQISDL
jgi:nitroreductase